MTFQLLWMSYRAGRRTYSVGRVTVTRITVFNAMGSVLRDFARAAGVHQYYSESSNDYDEEVREEILRVIDRRIDELNLEAVSKWLGLERRLMTNEFGFVYTETDEQFITRVRTIIRTRLAK